MATSSITKEFFVKVVESPSLKKDKEKLATFVFH